MSVKRFVFHMIIAATLMVAGQAALGAQGDEGQPPTDGEFTTQTDPRFPPIAYLTDLEHDFGTVKGGATVSYDFIVRNDGVGDLIIQKVSPG